MIVGITGRAGAGKDTFAEYLRDYNFATSAFAYPLKQMLCTLLDVPYEKWEDREWKETTINELGLSPREMAQTLGTEWGRNCNGKNFWVKIAMQRASEVMASLGSNWNFAFTDCRFENEADAIRNRGGYIIHIVRPGSDSATQSQHSSELGVKVNKSLGDIVVQNDGSLAELRVRALAVANDISMIRQAREAI